MLSREAVAQLEGIVMSMTLSVGEEGFEEKATIALSLLRELRAERAALAEADTAS